MAGSNILSATVIRPARGVIVQPAGARPGIGAVSVPGEQGPIGPLAGAPAFTTTIALSGHVPVYAKTDGSLAPASADDPATADAFVGITTQASAAGASVLVCVDGPMTEPSWAWTPGPVYLGLNGTLTQADPAELPGAAVILTVATAVSSTRIIVDPEPPIRFAA